MDQARRERVRELIRTLNSVQQQVHDLWNEEERDRSPPSKETELGQTSRDVVFHLGNATGHLQVAVEHLERAAGHDGADS